MDAWHDDVASVQASLNEYMHKPRSLGSPKTAAITLTSQHMQTVSIIDPLPYSGLRRRRSPPGDAQRLSTPSGLRKKLFNLIRSASNSDKHCCMGREPRRICFRGAPPLQSSHDSLRSGAYRIAYRIVCTLHELNDGPQPRFAETRAYFMPAEAETIAVSIQKISSWHTPVQSHEEKRYVRTL